jgi:RNA polymerase sigma factor (sigma-70 family)
MNISPSKKKPWEPNQESFDRLLAWLHEDRDEAGRKYEEIRHRLIKIFVCRGCAEAEDLTDETINRVMKRAPEIAPSYIGDPALYFLGVAHNVCREYFRRRPMPDLQPTPDVLDNREWINHHLEQCMKRLKPEDQEIILEYFWEEKKAKINRRRKLSERLGMTPNALRIRVHRVLKTLRDHMTESLGKKTGHERDPAFN